MYHLLTQTVYSLYFSTYLKEKASEAGEKHVGVGPRRQVNQSSLCFCTGIVLLQFYHVFSNRITIQDNREL